MRERSVRVRGVGWAREAFRAYYMLDPPLGEPWGIERREFAFQLFDSDSYTRHISFMNLAELRRYLRERVPRQAYYSVALYEVPEARDMEGKGWLGSELLVDIDPGPGVCTIVEGVPGDDCLEWAYREAVKIRDIMERDLGLRPEIYYTGHKGFHIKAGGEVLKLGRDARRLIAYYISGEGLDPITLFPKPRKGVEPSAPGRDDPGWRGWIARILGVDGGPVTKVLGSEWMDKIRRGVEEWRPRIDYQVTQDPSRLARIKGSLNGKAGFIVQDATQGFQPSPRVLTPFRGSLEVLPARTITGVTMLGYDVELREGRWEEVPAWLAVMLELKGLLRNARGEVVVRRINPPVGGPMMGSR